MPFGEESNRVTPKLFFRISEEQWENYEISFQMCAGTGSLQIKGYQKWALHVVFVSLVLLYANRKHDVTMSEKM